MVLISRSSNPGVWSNGRIKVDQAAPQNIVNPDIVGRAIAAVSHIDCPCDLILRGVDHFGGLFNEDTAPQEESRGIGGDRCATIVVDLIIMTAVIKIGGGNQFPTGVAALAHRHLEGSSIPSCKPVSKGPLIPV